VDISKADGMRIHQLAAAAAAAVLWNVFIIVF
jgi:hypothetical protein